MSKRIEIKDVSSEIPNEGSNGVRDLESVTHAVVHHSGVNMKGGSSLDRFQSYAKYHLSKGWKRCAYHYGIGCDGEIYRLNDEHEITWHAGNYMMNLKSIGICLDGNFTEKRVPPKMVEALWSLMVYLTTKRPDMPKLLPPTIKTHREVRRLGLTRCPSKQVSGIVKAFRKYVR